jgi:hypothetical protein
VITVNPDAALATALRRFIHENFTADERAKYPVVEITIADDEEGYEFVYRIVELDVPSPLVYPTEEDLAVCAQGLEAFACCLTEAEQRNVVSRLAPDTRAEIMKLLAVNSGVAFVPADERTEWKGGASCAST